MKPTTKGEDIAERDFDSLDTNPLEKLYEWLFLSFNDHSLCVQGEVVDGQPF